MYINTYYGMIINIYEYLWLLIYIRDVDPIKYTIYEKNNMYYYQWQKY